MNSTNTHKNIMIVALLLVLFMMVLVQGCGNPNTAPAGSTITVHQNASTWDSGGAGLGAGNTIPFDFTVVVTYPSSTMPMPFADITISGAYAAPNTSCPGGFLGGLGCYQFYGSLFFAGSTDTRNSPFTARTDRDGKYVFGALMTGPTPTFRDSVYIQSGSNVGFGTIELK
jgi:hypothetical protein